MAHRLRVIDVGRNLALILPGEMTEHILVAFFSRSKDHKLQILLAHLIHHVRDQVETLLISKTGYDADQELPLVLIQSEFLLEGLLVLHLLLAE